MDRFAVGVDEWRRRLGGLRNVVRQELVARQLARHLPAVPVRVLDAGCGQGTQAIRLARGGHRVTGLDASRELLDQARRALAAEVPEARERVRLVHGPVERATELFDTWSFDVVLCHGVLMYFPDPMPVLRALAAVAAAGSTLSVLVRNANALAMRPGQLGDWRTAMAAFETTSYRNRIGIEARADRREELTAALAHSGFDLREWYGVRVFTDIAPDDADLPGGDRLEELLACEERAGRTDPYRQVAPLLHLVALRRSTGVEVVPPAPTPV